LKQCPRCDESGFDGICCESCGYEEIQLPKVYALRSGYITLVDPNYRTPVIGSFHPKTKQEHIAIAERALGHALPTGAVVHHHDRNKANNANRNLVICENASYHALIHARMNWIARGINPDTEARCYSCKTVKDLNDFPRDCTHWNGRHKACRICKNGILKENTLRRRVASHAGALQVEAETQKFIQSRTGLPQYGQGRAQ